jgi:hypothetical protein
MAGIPSGVSHCTQTLKLCFDEFPIFLFNPHYSPMKEILQMSTLRLKQANSLTIATSSQMTK